LFTFLLLFFIYLLIKYRTQKLQDEKMKLERKVNERTRELHQSLEDLKSTQTQLIQSEKMASLGELTAGIAHEIQNPLNFVNNFSEVNTELIQEIKEERTKSKDERDESLENDLLGDLEQNLQKINHHGKRADAIVKSMLQHSRTSSGEKVPTDINALCDEYLRLAYHGLRAKDSTFNAKMETDFDTSIGKVNVIPQDIGRVVLNLITNAFQAVQERSKTGESGYAPRVAVYTELSPLRGLGGGTDRETSVQISIKDNGPGIPDSIKDKIFQPFFTTKPTGQGTGLGLSLAYDIVKAHGGELRVESKKGEGSMFTLRLPIV
jgi:signal transduction histidine kinase